MCLDGCMEVITLMTTYNRKCYTQKCLESIVNDNNKINFSFVVVDDNSNDGTKEMLNELKEQLNIEIISGSGNLFYSRGMSLGMDYIISKNKDCDYILLVNDDVSFFENCIEKLVAQSIEQENSIIVGATCDSKGILSYSAVKYSKGIKYNKVPCSEWNIKADTFNANCVLIPYKAFLEIGAMDKNYIHSLGDFDYGLSYLRKGYNIYVSKEYVGVCNNNTIEGTWLDTKLSVKERILKKEHIKGSPFKQWFYFLKKNFGITRAIFSSITPYIRILLRK